MKATEFSSLGIDGHEFDSTSLIRFEDSIYATAEHFSIEIFGIEMELNMQHEGHQRFECDTRGEVRIDRHGRHLMMSINRQHVQLYVRGYHYKGDPHGNEYRVVYGEALTREYIRRNYLDDHDCRCDTCKAAAGDE